MLKLQIHILDVLTKCDLALMKTANIYSNKYFSFFVFLWSQNADNGFSPEEIKYL